MMHIIQAAQGWSADMNSIFETKYGGIEWRWSKAQINCATLEFSYN